MTSEERDQLVEEKKREMSRERDEKRARTAREGLDPLGIKVKHAQEESHAAEQIQATFRGNRDRKKVKARKKDRAKVQQMHAEEGAAIKIQAIQRGKKDRKRVADKRQEMMLGGTDSMDVVIPGSLELRIPEDKAALKIQSIHRGKRDRAKVQQKKSEKVAATRIQSIHRGKQARAAVKEKRNNMKPAEAPDDADDDSEADWAESRKKMKEAA